MLSDGARPSEDIYFIQSAAPQLLSRLGIDSYRINVRSSLSNFRRLNIKRFAGAHIIICRSLNPKWLSFLEHYQSLFASINYIVDDDLSAASATHGLPKSYRNKLNKIVINQQQRIIALSDNIVVSSKCLLKKFMEMHSSVHLLTPVLCNSLPGLDHFDGGINDMAFLGTRAHVDDLKAIEPALIRVSSHAKINNLSLFLMLGKNLPSSLNQIPIIKNSSPKSWTAYQKHITGSPIHIGLSPLMHSPFNSARSWNKFLDITLAGGVGVYSNREPFTDIVDHKVNGLLVEDDEDAWFDALSWLLTNPNPAKEMAIEAQKTALELAGTNKAFEFWRNLLDL
ncbi:MAG: glycosyltransferase family 1 protein [Pseudomonadota bacterium]|nr:glycosyltransferase family 1 protein [Pseudomonadota bacterium]